MDRWDVLIICAAGYVAIMSLTRLMAHRRNQLVDQVRGQMAQGRGEKKQAPKQMETEPDRDLA